MKENNSQFDQASRAGGVTTERQGAESAMRGQRSPLVGAPLLFAFRPDDHHTKAATPYRATLSFLPFARRNPLRQPAPTTRVPPRLASNSRRVAGSNTPVATSQTNPPNRPTGSSTSRSANAREAEAISLTTATPRPPRATHRGNTPPNRAVTEIPATRESASSNWRSDWASCRAASSRSSMTSSGSASSNGCAARRTGAETHCS